MARGWESKSVEDQIEAAQTVPAQRPLPTPDEQAREVRRATLSLARARALQDLQLACDTRHRALLQQTLSHLDAELATIDAAS